MRNLIAFKNNLVTTELVNTLTDLDLVAEFQHLLLTYGYSLTNDAFDQLLKTSDNYMDNLITEIKGYFFENIGNTSAKELKELYFMYGNESDHDKKTRLAKDQKDLRKKKLASIYSDNVYTSMLSYCNLIWENKTNTEEIPQIYETVKFNFIEFANETKFKQIFTNLSKIGTALTPNDFKTIEWFANEYGNDNIMPNAIPFKENLCMLASLGMNVPVKTPTDVLRIATYMSNQTTDLFLPPKMIKTNAWSRQMIKNPARDNAKFKKFKRSERRYLLSLLEKVANPKEMVLRKERWIKLGEILHPSEYSNRFPLTAKAFDILRNTKVKSWYGDVDAAFSKSLTIGLVKLSERPGEFGRRLDSLIRHYPYNIDMILESFKLIGNNISGKVLWELYSHFENRTMTLSRKVLIKGSRTPKDIPTLEIMDEKIVLDVQNIIIDIITSNFAKLDKLGNVYIDSELKKIPVPTNMRTIQDATKVVVRGTRLPLNVSKKVLRPYIHWTAGVDLDISISLIDDAGKHIVCSYGNINPHPAILHSGDVIPRVKGNWAEYIDIDIEKNPYKYGLVSVRNFAGTSLEDVGAVVGFMQRDNLISSISWKPSTVETSFKVSSNGSSVNLFIIDFETMEWVLIDEDVDGIPKEYSSNILKYIDDLSKEPKLSVYDVLEMHTVVRGHKVENESECDVSFKFDDFSTSYEKIAGYML